MNTQTITASSGAGPLHTLRAGRVLPLGSVGGRLEVLHGRVWLTLEGDRDDHLVAAGDPLRVPANSRAVLEAWDDEDPALIAWQPGTALDRVSAYLRTALGRGWEIVDPAPRISVGTVAALLAVFVIVAVFGPLSDARSRSLAGPTLLHNSSVPSAPAGVAGSDREGNIDAGAATPGRARVTAQETRRRAPIPA